MSSGKKKRGRNNDRNGGQSMKDLAQVREQTPPAPPADDLPTPEAIQAGDDLLSTAEAQMRAQRLDDTAAQLTAQGGQLGKALRELDDNKPTRSLQLTRIKGRLEDLLKLIINVRREEERVQLARAFISALVAEIPETYLGISMAAEAAERLKMIRRAGDTESSDEMRVCLPLPPSPGKRPQPTWVVLCCPRDSAERLRRISINLRREAREKKEKELERLYQEGVVGTDLLQALKSGGGEVAFFVPADPARGYLACHLRARVDNGEIIPVRAVGPGCWLVETAAEAGLVLPLAQVRAERLELKERLPQEEFVSLLAFQGMLRRATGYAESAPTARFLDELARAERYFAERDGFVGCNHFLGEWRGDHFPRDRRERQRLLEELRECGKVEVYDTNGNGDSVKAIRRKTTVNEEKLEQAIAKAEEAAS